MSETKIVAVTGSLGSPSRTVILARSILRALSEHVQASVELVEVAEVGAAFGGVLTRKSLDDRLEGIIRSIEVADLLVVASPVYRGTYTGLFKHVFDLVHHEALVDVPVILAATGGSDRHALIIDHALRPLFSFFRAQPVPVGIYATEGDFKGEEIINSELDRRIELAARQAARALAARSHGAGAVRHVPEARPS